MRIDSEGSTLAPILLIAFASSCSMVSVAIAGVPAGNEVCTLTLPVDSGTTAPASIPSVNPESNLWRYPACGVATSTLTLADVSTATLAPPPFSPM